MFEHPITPLAAAALLAAAAGCGGSATPAPKHPKLVSDDAPVSHHAAAPDDGDGDDSSGLQVSGLHGRLDQYAIQQGVKPHADAINRCYYENIGRRRYVGGKIELAFRIARDGTVKRVKIASSDLGAWPVEKCLLEVAHAMTFTAPTGGEAKFSLPLDFAGRGAVTTWNEQRADIEIHINPALDAWRKRWRYRRRHRRRHHRRHHHVVDPRPKTKLQKLAACAGDDGGRPPSGATITLYVGRHGVVTSAGFAADDGAHIDPAWADCAVAALETWKLTPPVAGLAKTSFHYPVRRR